MKVIIVDDEPKAIELITSYLSHYKDFQIVSTFRNGLKALGYLNANSIDIVFLDINMPHLNGLSLSKMIPEETAIVFTTAYSEHALESYDVNAVDYLLKPISLERFSKTIIKLINRFNHTGNKTFQSNDSSDFLFIKSGTETYHVKIRDIEYLKKDANYMHYFVGEQKIIARESITEALTCLDKDFIQIQKSYIVNFKKIHSVNTNFVTIGNVQIPIGLQYKDQIFAKIKGQHPLF